MNIDDGLLTNAEKLKYTLSGLYKNSGYKYYSMGKFEEYDLYAKNKDFLVSDNVITFTDTDGKLLALKPDVTLSIIKNSKDRDKVQKLFYSENVYRVSKGTGSFKEIMQTGAECFGPLTNEDVAGVIRLASESIGLIAKDGVLSVSSVDILSYVIGEISDDAEKKEKLFNAAGDKNFNLITSMFPENEKAGKLIKLLSVGGPLSEDTLSAIKEVVDGAEEKFPSFFETVRLLENTGSRIRLDFSVTDDFNYYNGLVFKGYVKNVPNPVLSGGQYDKLMKKLGRSSKAVGFAVYTDELERFEEAVDDGYINIALPKGRLGEKVYKMFESAGFECPAILEQNRKLIFENPEKKLRFFWVKPSDVAIYVERGAADCGVAGKDILTEYGPDVYELLDLKTGICRMCVAAPVGFKYSKTKKIKVATKFTSSAREFYRKKGYDIDIIHLNGSIEIAPILGLSDVIVDIVETGTTLKENNLEVKEEVYPISARFISNKSSYRFKGKKIQEIADGIQRGLDL